MMAWLNRHAVAIQAITAMLTVLVALAALFGVKWQIDASAQAQREQSARDIYREFLNLSIARPDLAEPDVCALRGTTAETAYGDYLEYLFYTAEQVLDASPDWERTLQDRLKLHREALCPMADQGEETPEVRALLRRFRAAQCKGFVSACAR